MGKQGNRQAEMIGSYFDTHAEGWSSLYKRAEYANDIVLAERLELALSMTEDLKPGSRVLDAGCGAGPITIAMAAREHQVVAVDLSGKMLDLCRDSIEEQGMGDAPITLHRGNVLELDLPPGTFDAVIALGFLQYQEDEVATLKRLRNLLKPGGKLVVSGPIYRRLGNLFGLWVPVQKARRYMSKRFSGQDNPELEKLLTISRNNYTARRIKKLVVESGLNFVEAKRHGYANFAVIGPWLGASGEISLHHRLTRISRWLPIDYFANDLVAPAVKPV